MSSLTLAEEISARLLDGPTQIFLDTPSGKLRITTLQELRDALLPFGLEITTDTALAWGIKNPIQAAHINQICELTQQVDELAASLYDSSFDKKLSAE